MALPTYSLRATVCVAADLHEKVAAPIIGHDGQVSPARGRARTTVGSGPESQWKHALRQHPGSRDIPSLVEGLSEPLEINAYQYNPRKDGDRFGVSQHGSHRPKSRGAAR
jgi:hypothetical protein